MPNGSATIEPSVASNGGVLAEAAGPSQAAASPAGWWHHTAGQPLRYSTSHRRAGRCRTTWSTRCRATWLSTLIERLTERYGGIRNPNARPVRHPVRWATSPRLNRAGCCRGTAVGGACACSPAPPTISRQRLGRSPDCSAVDRIGPAVNPTSRCCTAGLDGATDAGDRDACSRWWPGDAPAKCPPGPMAMADRRALPRHPARRHQPDHRLPQGGQRIGRRLSAAPRPRRGARHVRGMGLRVPFGRAVDGLDAPRCPATAARPGGEFGAAVEYPGSIIRHLATGHPGPQPVTPQPTPAPVPDASTPPAGHRDGNYPARESGTR